MHRMHNNGNREAAFQRWQGDSGGNHHMKICPALCIDLLASVNDREQQQSSNMGGLRQETVDKGISPQR